MDNFETRNEFAPQDSDNAAESQAADVQGNSAQAMNLRNADIVLRPDANGVVVLSEGASLDNMTAQGRDLVIVLDDGTRIIIPDGAIIVPQIVIDGVTVPAANLAALLTGNEPQPAAGDPQSSGGNFEVDPGNIQAAYALGDLLPYTELQFPQPEEREIIPALAELDPDIVIETPDNPVGVINAIATVDEDGLPGRTIDGASEPEGTRSQTNSETASGTIVFNAPDGVGSVLINGVAITSIGQTFQGDTGTLTITNIDLANGRIGFSFTLEDNMVGGELDGSFMMSIIDSDGDRADANLQIRIIDDAPIAADDANSVAAGTFGPIAGSVLINDESGADGYAAGSPVTGFANGGGSAEPGDTLVGTYGELTLNADGSYSYIRYFNTPGGVSEEFTYTITDADGSTSTATLTIDIGDANDAITNVPDGEEATVVEEGQLPPTTGTRDDEPQGSDFDGDNETVTGTITFTSPDGVGSVSVGGTVIDPTNLPQAVVSDDTGTLTVIDYTYDPVTGEGTITYEYELTDNTGDPEGTTVDFPIVVIDLDGDVAEDDLVITIIDDVPEAFDDTGAQSEENSPITVDALDNDITGADGVDLATGVAVVDGTLSGDGSVTYNGDGTFTYTPAAGEEGTVAFDYAITDGDGDISTATVTITLQPDSAPEIAVTGQDTVFEEALGVRGDEPAGSNAASDGEFASGSINIATGSDSVDTLVINGVDVTGGGTVTTDRGVLTVSVTDGAYSYSYELTDNTLADPDSDSFTLVVTDSDGDTAQTTLVVSIVDDNPSAADDANAITAGEYGPVGANVLTNDVEGADGAEVTSYTGANGTGSAGDTIEGEYGTLIIAADGTYSYTRNPGTEGGVSDSFTYTITDGDGDTATANLVIAIADSPVVLDLPVAGEDGTLVDEAGLPAGSDAASDSEFTSGTFTYDAPDSPATVTIGGETVTAVGQTITGSFGTLTITSIADGAIGYTYELTTSTNGDDTFDSFEVTVTDQDGDVASGDLDIAIVDDVPTAVADTDSVTEDGPLTADGNVITNAEANGDNGGDTTGADGASVTDVSFGGNAGTVGGATPSAYGSLVLNTDGSYTYTLDNTNAFVQGLDGTESLTEVFTYTLTDGDGDISVTTLTVTINGDDDIVTINGLDLQTPELTVDEDDLADGSSPDAAALTPTGDFTVDSPDGLNTLTVGGVQVWGGGESYPISIPGAYGTVNVTGVTVTTDANGDVIAATVSYVYELSDNTLDHMANGEDQLVDSLEVVATDSDGSQDTASLDIDVVDDVPTARADMDTVSEGASVSGDVLANDTIGADGAEVAGNEVTGVAAGDTGVPASGNVGTSVAGLYGTLTINADGSYTYESDPDAVTAPGATDTFTYTITDGDGDTSTTTIEIDVTDVTLAADNDTVTVDEDGLPVIGSEAATDSETAGGTLSVNGAVSYALVGSGTGSNGTLTLNANGTYSYTLATPVDGTTLDNGENTVTGVDSFTYVATDADGNTVQGTITIDVVDDVPIAITPDDAFIFNNFGETALGPLYLDSDQNVVYDFGADGPGLITFANITSGVTTLSEVGGTPLLSGGDPIVLVLTNNGQTLEARAGSNVGELVFTVDLLQNVDGGTYTVTMGTAPLDNGSGTAFDDLSGGTAGNPPFKLIDSSTAGTTELAVTPRGTATTINSDSDDIAAGSQFISAPDGIRFDFGDFTYSPNGGGSSDDTFSQVSLEVINGFRFTIDQISEGTSAAIKIVAQLDPNPAQAELDSSAADSSGDDVPQQITSVEIYDDLGNLIAEVFSDGTNVGGTDVDVNFGPTAEDGVTIHDIPTNWSILTNTANGYTAIEIDNVADTDPSPSGEDGKFSISELLIELTQQGSDLFANFDLQITDGDGDSVVVTDGLAIEFDADGVPDANMAAVPSSMKSSAVMADAELLDTAMFGSGEGQTGTNGMDKSIGSPRIIARGNEITAIAASAAAFAMPTIGLAFTQEYVEIAPAAGQMVNFEFASDLEITAVQLPEAYATSFEGFVEIAPAMLEGPMMANILEGGTFDMPQFEAVAGIDTGGVDFMADMAATANLSGGPSVFEGFAGGNAASAMEALLMLEAPAKVAEADTAQEPGKGVGETVAEIAAEAEVDAIVDHFAAGDGPAVAVTPPEGLLDSMIGNEAALHAMGMMPQDQNGEAAALAAASA
jgi:VCBS repeat-containing protein